MLVVTPNTCLDITTHLHRLRPGTVARAAQTRTTAGGKGVNVCRGLRLLGHDPTLVGLASCDVDLLGRLLADEGCRFLPIGHPGPGRVAHIFLEENQRVTVVNGSGPFMDAHDWARVAAALDDAVDDAHDAVVCSGSLPPGAPPVAYAEVVKRAHARGLLAVVDAAPAVLAEALASRPDVVSPNLAEAESLLSGTPVAELVDDAGDDVPERCLEASRELHVRGARSAVVTGGRHGAALTDESGSWWAQAPLVAGVSPIGAGDGFVAGMVDALVRGRSATAGLRAGVGVAAATCESDLAGSFDAARADELVVGVDIGEHRIARPATVRLAR